MKKPWTTLQLNPTQVIVLGFALTILIGTVLLMLPIATVSGETTPFIDAFFTATSAVCVTGLVVFDTGLYWTTFGQVVIITLIQVGGLGFMTIGTLFALLAGKKISYKERVLMQESVNKLNLSGIVVLVKRILILTLTIELSAAVLLAFRFSSIFGWQRGIWYGLFHAISGFNNAGFDLLGPHYGEYSSLLHFQQDLLINSVIMALIILGGIGFTVIIEVLQKRSFHKLSLHSRVVLRVTLILLLIGTLLTFLFEYDNPTTLGNLSLGEKILPSFFYSVTLRTAGFSTINLSQLSSATLLLSVILMIIGASSGGTGGGVKTGTFAVVYSFIRSVIKGDEDAHMFERRIPREIVRKAITIVGLALSIYLSVSFALSIFEHDTPLNDILFEVASAFGTVGLTTGITPGLHDVSKLVLCITMFSGRVGPLTLFLALSRRNHKLKNVRYVQEEIIVG